jgi:hypothetical protein
MHAAGIALWAGSLALQCILLAILIFRRRALRLPVFTLLIAFYVLRSVALFVLKGHLAPLSFSQLYEGLSVVDTLLQLTVAGEIALKAARQYGDAERARLSRVLLLALAGVLIAVFATALLPSRGPVPIDRGSVLVAFLMLLLWLWMAVDRRGGPVRRVVDGFAAYSVAAIVSNVVHNQAGLHRNERIFRDASWAQSVVYVLVVAFWCLALRCAGSTVAAPQRERVQA